MKFPQGEGSAVIHRKKNRPALQRRDILNVSLFYFFNYFCKINLLNSSSTHFLVVLFFLAFYTVPFPSKHSFVGLFVRSLFTQLFFVVVLLLWLHSMTAFSYVGLLSLFWMWLLHAVFLSHLPPSSFLVGMSSEQFAELESVHLLAFSARACSLAFLSLGVAFLAISRAFLIILSFFSRVCSKAFLSLVIVLISAIRRAHFSYFSWAFFFVGLLLPRFSSFWFRSF